MAEIRNVSVFGLASSIFRSGYPMLDVPPTEEEFTNTVAEIHNCIEHNDYNNRHIQRAISLANAKGGGHDQYLTGIVVNFDMTIANKAWVEAERYTFLNFISSMSTMHKIASLGIKDGCNNFVSDEMCKLVEQMQHEYNTIDGDKRPEEKKAARLRLLYNLPAGFEITAGMTTNYRCLKNVYTQRRNHRLPDWNVVCDWIETLPMSDYLITGKAVQ